MKRREDFNREINKIIEQGLVKKKIDVFRAKIDILQKSINQKEQQYKPIHLPRSFMIKRNQKSHLNDASSMKKQRIEPVR